MPPLRTRSASSSSSSAPRAAAFASGRASSIRPRRRPQTTSRVSPIPSSEQVLPRLLADGDDGGGRELTLARHRVEAVTELLDPTDDAYAMALADFAFDGRRSREDAFAMLAERVHQLRIVELAKHRRT